MNNILIYVIIFVSSFLGSSASSESISSQDGEIGVGTFLKLISYPNPSEAIITASQRGNLIWINVLGFAGADLNTQDLHGNTPLIYASLSGYASIVRSLLKFHKGSLKRVQIFATNRHGENAIDVATSNVAPILKEAISTLILEDCAICYEALN